MQGYLRSGCDAELAVQCSERFGGEKKKKHRGDAALQKQNKEIFVHLPSYTHIRGKVAALLKYRRGDISIPVRFVVHFYDLHHVLPAETVLLRLVEVDAHTTGSLGGKHLCCTEGAGHLRGVLGLCGRGFLF